MANTLNFTLKDGLYVAKLENIKATITVDIERDNAGFITVSSKLHGANIFKMPIDVPNSQAIKDIKFNILADNGAETDYQITSTTKVTSAYYG